MIWLVVCWHISGSPPSIAPVVTLVSCEAVQVLFVNCVAVWWNFVLSMTQHK